MPLLIYVVLQSNVQYILRFRNQDKLGGEAGYYLSSLVRMRLKITRNLLTRIDGRGAIHRKFGPHNIDHL